MEKSGQSENDSTLSQIYDLSSCERQRGLIKQLGADEKIIFSCPLKKFNRRGKIQERNFMITNLAVYNLRNFGIRRKISIEKIKALTLSKISSQFVIHVPEEYDYRFSSDNYRERIVQYLRQGIKEKIKIYYKDLENLEVFTTTRINKQKQINKIPQGVPDLLLEPVLQQFGKLDLKMVIEDFEVVKVLGRGAFGKVVLAKYKANQQFYAIKCLKKEAINENNIDRIKVERQILECTNSPFLVKLHFAFQDLNRVYFVIDFKQGGELFFLIQQSRKFSEERAKFYAAQIILALEQLHKNNIIYRDLKPENILLDDKGNLSLADFGLSKIFESNQSEEEQTSHSFVGSAEYISPEILLNQGHSYSTDFWSLGALIYEMIYGLPPFYNKNQQKMFEMTLSREVRFNNKVQCSQECKNLILKLLQKIPKKRPNINEIKKDEWFKDIDFQKIQNLQVQPPFVPQIENEEWVKNFDKECIKEQPVQSYVDNQKVQNFEIAGITYLEKKI